MWVLWTADQNTLGFFFIIYLLIHSVLNSNQCHVPFFPLHLPQYFPLITNPFLPLPIQGSLSLLLSNCFYGYRDAPCFSLHSTQPPPEVTGAPFVSTNQRFGGGLPLWLGVFWKLCITSASDCFHILPWSITPLFGWMIDAFEPRMGPIFSLITVWWTLRPITAYAGRRWCHEAPH